MKTTYKRGMRFAASVMTVASLLLLNACQDHPRIPPMQGGPSLRFYALNSSNQLFEFNAQNTGTANSTVTITGLQAGETMLGIDFRPATGQLYGVGSSSRLYVINPSTGVARMVGMGPITPALNGDMVGFDFNPTVDRIRLVTNTGQSLRANPETAAMTIVDGSINGGVGGTPAVAAVAYANSRAGVTATVLRAIDPVTDRLYRIDPPNNGTLVEIGTLGLDITRVGGFDISFDNAFAIASFQFEGKWELNQINVTTGKAQKLGNFPLSAGDIIGIAIPTEAVAYAVDAANNLLIFNPMSSPTTPIAKPITGLQAAENILGLDFRPANGQLYAVGSTNRIYTINTSSGAATMVGAGAFTPALSGSDFGVDFNPQADRLRVVSNLGQNLRINPADAVVATDMPLNPGTPSVTAAAYTNNFAGTASTVLFDIDSNTDRLLIQTPPNNGTLNDVGPLGINVENVNGFDITGRTGTAYAIFKVGGSSGLYTINLTSGAATKVVDFPVEVRGFTVGLGF